MCQKLPTFSNVTNISEIANFWKAPFAVTAFARNDSRHAHPSPTHPHIRAGVARNRNDHCPSRACIVSGSAEPNAHDAIRPPSPCPQHPCPSCAKASQQATQHHPEPPPRPEDSRKVEVAPSTHKHKACCCCCCCCCFLPRLGCVAGPFGWKPLAAGRGRCSSGREGGGGGRAMIPKPSCRCRGSVQVAP